MDAGTYSIKQVYNLLRGPFNKVPWRRLICNNIGSPRWVFILYTTLQEILYTRDKLDKQGIITDKVCALCNSEDETHQHLFFMCSTSEQMWNQMLKWLSINRQGQSWEDEITWAIQNAGKKDINLDMYRATVSAAVYFIWQERNYRIFQQRNRIIEQLVRLIIQEIYSRCRSIPKMASTLNSLNFYPQKSNR